MLLFFFEQETAYELCQCDWSSDVCSSDLQTSVRDIAKRANISLGNLYGHFDSKVALIAEIAALEADELGDIERDLEVAAAPDKVIERFAGSYFDYAAQPENAVLAAEITAEAMRAPGIAEGFIQNRERLVTKLDRKSVV